MHDVRAIREDPQAYVQGWSARGVEGSAEVVGEILKLDAELRATQTALQDGQARRNESSKLIGHAKSKKDEAEAQRLMAQVEELKGAIAANFEAEGRLGTQLRDTLAALPNLAAPDVPVGGDEEGNVELRRWGEPFAIINPKDHVELGEALGLMDFEAASRMSGSRFVVLEGQLARLERAIGQFMLDLQTGESGYTEVSPPLLVRDEAIYGVGFSARRTYDLEVWLPSQGRYREISSCSNCGDFQARRMDARCKAAGAKGTRLVHTLNGSGLAIGRTLVAIMENYQDEGGRIAIPQALHPYMRGVTHIGEAS
jgi:seryl-tRNA synthetase